MLRCVSFRKFCWLIVIFAFFCAKIYRGICIELTGTGRENTWSFDVRKVSRPVCKWRMLMMVSVLLENEHPDKYWYRSKPQNRRDVKNETPKKDTQRSQKSLKNDYLQLLELQGTSERKLSFCPVITWNRSGLCSKLLVSD